MGFGITGGEQGRGWAATLDPSLPGSRSAPTAGRFPLVTHRLSCAATTLECGPSPPVPAGSSSSRSRPRRRRLAWFLRRGPGSRSPCRHGAQYVVEGVSELDRGRGRKCKPRRYMNDGLLPLLGCIVDSFGQKKTRCSYGDEDCAAIESGTDDLIPVNFQDTGIVLNPGFLLCVCHGSLLGRRYGAEDYGSCSAPKRRADAPSGSIWASSRSSFWPHKEYLMTASVSSWLCCSNARTLS